MSKDKLTEADKIWEEIKDLRLVIFALPNQTVKQHVKKLAVPGDKLLIQLNSSATLPALEEALVNNFNVEVSDQYTIVSRKQAPIDVSKFED